MATVPSFAAFRSSNLGGGTGTPGENIGHGDSLAEAISRASSTHPHAWIKHLIKTGGKDSENQFEEKKKSEWPLFFLPLLLRLSGDSLHSSSTHPHACLIPQFNVKM